VVHLHRLHQSHGDHIEFLFVHIRDAYQHLPAERRDFGKNRENADRRQQIHEDMEQHHLALPCLLDRADGEVEMRYQAFPNRLLLINRDGRIAFDYRGISGTTVSWDEVERWMQAEQTAPPH
jgi:hypothetical protein